MPNLPLAQPASSEDTRWKSLIDPVLNSVLLQGVLLKNVTLQIGINTINTTLGKTSQGYLIADQNAAAQIYRSQPLNDKTLTLTSDAIVTLSLWIF